MKNSIAYSQALHLNKICYIKRDLEKNYQKLLKTLTEVKTKLKPYLTSIKLLPLPGIKFWIKTQQRTMKQYLLLQPLTELSDLRHTTKISIFYK